ncbi:MAG: NAD(P)H-dependent oxidoreductase subunit E [Thermoprotei archaeon]|nr:MAG: NAD(P)H-dependent oxidoreductase subunit E [Thermoprotei archaeon]
MRRYRPYDLLEPDPKVASTLEKELAKRGNPTNLLEVLRIAQNTIGYINKDVIFYVAKRMRLPVSKVYGVVTFYREFNLRQLGEHICAVCMGTACYINGAPEILRAIEKFFNVKPGGTSPDKKLSLIIVRCIGCCANAPNIMIDGRIIGNVTPEKAIQRIEEVVRRSGDENKKY